MFNIPAITWTLTTVLLLSGSYHLQQAIRSRHLTAQANESLHALMNALMAAMLWNLAPSTMLAQIAVLAGAALWFAIQAVARPEFKILCEASQGRLKCIYHSLTMAGAALMIAMMGNPTTPGHGTLPASTTPMTHNHHTTTATPQNTTTALDHNPALAIALTILFGTAALTFTLLLLHHRTTKPKPHTTPHPKHPNPAQHALEALAATTMALMFATMTT